MKRIKYKDSYGTEYTTNPISDNSLERKIKSIQETNNNKATIISIEKV